MLTVEDMTAAEKDARLSELYDAVAFLTECELATVEYMEGLSNPTKSQLERHRNIAEIGLRVLQDKYPGRSINADQCPRVQRYLEQENR